ncbi:unnamed protein product [Owenia fusiformis]|uniref:EF-hand domain-containing protein n=1 Tax=Owenia fusiformis TaxID=6347 RepID=A0A8S4NNK0_OWEFU|nr:unnamed protein product [Owenia fusiformis]
MLMFHFIDILYWSICFQAVNEGLIEIDLSWNSIREKGAVAVGKALSTNGTLEILDLSWNGFGVKGAIHLMRALKVNNKLRVLDLSNNRINNEGAKKLGLGVAKNMSVETLLLGMNPIGEEGMEALLKGINKNEKLKLVGIEGCVGCKDITLTSGVFKKIQELEAERDIILMHGGVGGFEKSRVIGSVIQVFDRFINDNALRLEDLFVQLDKDKSGDVTLEEMKYGLKNAGLCLTSKLIDVLLQMIDNDGNGTIEYSELLNGSALVEKERRRAVFKRSDIKN